MEDIAYLCNVQNTCVDGTMRLFHETGGHFFVSVCLIRKYASTLY